jgi:hypothetical protein
VAIKMMKAFFMDSPWRVGGRSFIVPEDEPLKH